MNELASQIISNILEEKEEVVYYFKITNSDKLKEGDSIRIEVAS